ncbi:Uncharacterised protein [Mycobacteroides abscessus subsp. abscessus]|nr:Uncharacterised protein [Mycobacteroides abscessus subsp. abscessus]
MSMAPPNPLSGSFGFERTVTAPTDKWPLPGTLAV